MRQIHRGTMATGTGLATGTATNITPQQQQQLHQQQELQQHPSSARIVTAGGVDNISEYSFSERQPLIPTQRELSTATTYLSLPLTSSPIENITSKKSKFSTCCHRGIWILVLFIFFTIAGNLIYIFLTLQQQLIKVASIDVVSLNFGELSQEGGVDFSTCLKLQLDYEKTDKYHRFVFGTFGKYIDTVSFNITKDLPVSLGIDDIEGYVFDVGVNDNDLLVVNLNNQSYSQFDIGGIAQIKNGSLLANFVNSISKAYSNDELVNLKLGSTVNGNLNITKFGLIHDISLYVEQKFMGIDLRKTLDSVVNTTDFFSVDKLKIVGSQEGDEYTGNAIISARTFDWLTFELRPLEWEVSLPGCSGKDMYIASFHTEGFKFTNEDNRESFVGIPFNFTIPTLSHELTKVCSNDNGKSALNSVVSRFLDGDDIVAVVSGFIVNDDDDGWFNQFVQKLKVRLTLNPSSINFSPFEDPVKKIEIKSMGIQIMNGSPLISANVQLGIRLPKEIKGGLNHVDVKSVRGDIKLKNGAFDVCDINMNEWQQTSLNSKKLVYDVMLNDGLLNIENEDMLSMMIMEMINGGDVDVGLKMEVDTVIDSPFVSTTLNDIDLIMNHHIKASKKSLGDLMDSIKMKLNTIKFVASDSSFVKLQSEIALFNPFDIDVSNGLSSAKVDIGFNGSNIGVIEIGSFNLFSQQYNNLTALITLQIDSDTEKSRLEEMFGNYVSGNSPLMRVKGRTDSIEECQSLSNVMSNVEVEMLLPQFSNEDDGDDNDGKKKKKGKVKKSIFLIDSTIHVMTSEIELTVYNPIENHEVVVTIIEGKGSYDGTTIAYVSNGVKLTIPPGVQKTPRIPVTLVRSGIGGEILKGGLLSGGLSVDSQAVLGITLGKFEMDILFHGSGMDSKIRL
ncbi:hypothetical protein CANARDRAFT_72852 [[Candida] arabinofermentans NRRL YB-2248]|uniref:AsmA-like C-terminal domain-containing protein n=1 Tax=[Candida] arabinofermentans NRRL YB-2248 TaxID=983967 RepID=A0A1E4SWH0_9ASCO|nr:hypothetical protein CANARDRAFT_72852 [[Candida] arabinofermentans NRRL YB-2248]